MDITATDPLAQYNSRSMLMALEQGNQPEMFLRNRLINGTTYHDTDIVQIDVEKSGDTVAAYVSRAGDATEIKKRNYSTNLHAVPYLYDSQTLTPKDLKVRTMGESVLEAGATKGTKLDRLVGKALQDMQNRFARNEERQVAEAIQTGKITVVGKDVDYTVDFQMDADHLIDGSGDPWTAATADILGQIEAACEVISDSGAPPATEMYLGTTAANGFLKNAAIKEALDNRRMEIGGITPTQLSAQKATRLGTLRWNGFELEVFSYKAKYVDEAGATQSYIDPVNAVLGSPAARFNMHYGMIENMMDTFGVAQFPDRDSSNKKKELITLESAPLAGLHQPDGYARIKTS